VLAGTTHVVITNGVALGGLAVVTMRLPGLVSDAHRLTGVLVAEGSLLARFHSSKTECHGLILLFLLEIVADIVALHWTDDLRAGSRVVTVELDVNTDVAAVVLRPARSIVGL
jgi:hypothetical protein